MIQAAKLNSAVEREEKRGETDRERGEGGRGRERGEGGRGETDRQTDRRMEGLTDR